MTLIAAFSAQKCPIIFGDLLLTREGAQNEERPVAVPALGDVRNFFEDSGWIISGLAQKVVLISPTCAIAWAGSWIGARSVVSDLREMVQQELLTADSIHSYLKQNSDLQQHPVSIIGWVEEEKGLRQFWYQANNVLDGGQLGMVATAGSGHSVLTEFVELTTSSPFATAGDVGPCEMAQGTSLTLASILIRAELHGGNSAPTLLSMFGGGYETAIYAGGRFCKIGDVTFIIWEANVTKDGVGITFPQLILKQQYLEDVLLLRSARITEKSGNLVLQDEQYHAVLPMYPVSREFIAQNLKEVSLESNKYCHCFNVHSGSENMIYTRIEQSASEQVMTIKDSEGKIMLGINDDFLKKIAEKIHSGATDQPGTS